MLDDNDNDQPSAVAEGYSLLKPSSTLPSHPNPSLASFQSDTTTQKHASVPSRMWRKWERYWRDGWHTEYWSCSLAIVSLVLMSWILKSYEHERLPEWPLHITINSIIALLTAFLKAGLALPLSEAISQLKWELFQHCPQPLITMDDFDSASRGPWGSLQLIFRVEKDYLPKDANLWRRILYPVFRWRLRNYRVYLAKLAAFLLIITFLSDPFSQQIVRFVQCPESRDDLDANISKTNYYNAAGPHTGAIKNEIDGPMNGAINRALNDPPANASSVVSTNCRSGNCTYPLFSTVGVCHKVESIPEEIRVNLLESTSGQPYPGPTRNVTLLTNGMWVANYTGYTVAPICKTQTSSSMGDGTLLSLKMLMDWTTPVRDYDKDTTEEDPNGLLAFNLEIFPCIRTYQSSITNFILDEKLIATTQIGLSRRPGFFGFLLGTSQTLRNGKWEKCLSSQTPGPGLEEIVEADIDAAPTGEPVPESPTIFYPQDCIWKFAQSSLFAIHDALDDAIGHLELDLDTNYYIPVGSVAAKSICGVGVEKSSKSVDNFLQNLTDVMTATIRRRGSGGAAEYVQGITTVQSTCIEIRWAWFTYPVVLVLLTTSFFLLVTLKSHNGQKSIWKSSSLAVLFCSLDETMRERTRSAWGRDDIFQYAEETQAQLVSDSEGKAVFN
ncbi:hypothetical protein P153DRAFT_398990 [Dothidotthia symphoricarpi CBS 119687]|uniref:Uncharacterized protein n=1 Tax=Dothidotthia symphoricarpi CBS 119687 TaxID=1392245 RepID=A0A6A6A6T3_9PLEO|nr:uncharacterized protein P153DRAFT_398990 [Dothidotthia symphoricarpi CBS 119687]KAF2126905.1 hypothetical protein P153DRAFT_398990 [Dothidotthia symphoricarpi CBS 119687]